MPTTPSEAGPFEAGNATTGLPWLKRLAVPVAIVSGYAAGFGWLTRELGPDAASLGVVAVLAAAASRGLVPGLAVAAGCLLVAVYHNGISHFASAGSLATTLALPLVGAVVGRLRDLHAELDQEMAKRRQSELQLRTAREAADAANVAKSAFLARMSHEIRTPMHGVLGMAQVLAETPLSGEQRQHLHMVVHSGQLLLSVINDVLDFSKIEAGKLNLESADFELQPVLRESFELVAMTAHGSGLELKVSLAPDLAPFVRGDALRIRQIVVNLLSNATKFTHRGSVTLRASTEAVGPDRVRLRVQVQDTGIGIEASAIARIFLPFGQADSSTTRVFGGTGLGLAICKHLCESMGGNIGCTSQLGLGSQFWFTLELPIGSAPAAAIAPDFSAPVRAHGKVLVAEDNRINQVIAQRLIEALGVQVEVVSDGEAAVAAAQTGGFDVVLLDCQMPKLDGFEAARRIRRLPGAAGRVPIVAVTASVLPSDHEQCALAGMDQILLKPLHAEDLRQAILRRLPASRRNTSEIVAVTKHPELPVIDVSVLADLKRAGGREVVRTVIALFEESASESAAELRAAQQDMLTLAQLAHRQRGTAGSVGARSLAASLSRLENAAHAGQAEHVAAALDDCDAQLLAVRQVLKRFHNADSAAFAVPLPEGSSLS